MNSPDSFDPQLQQWLRSFPHVMGRRPTQAEIAEYKLSRTPVRQLVTADAAGPP